MLEPKTINFLEKISCYDEGHCWQYNIRLDNYERDVIESGLSKETIKELRTEDFTYKLVTSKREQAAMTAFILRHEWLGTLSQLTTHWFAAYYKGILAGVILMNIPNAFSKLLGEETKDVERLVSRGACISWSPKNLASNFLMWCIKYMVKNTQYRLFTAYSDVTAMELGTIYQACNWFYLGQKFGATEKYINPYNGKMVSDRAFRQVNLYKKYAQDLCINWSPGWNDGRMMIWNNVPDDIEQKLRDLSKIRQSESPVIKFPFKHKYAYVLGASPKETKALRKKLQKNKTYPYPKDREVDHEFMKYIKSIVEANDGLEELTEW